MDSFIKERYCNSMYPNIGIMLNTCHILLPHVLQFATNSRHVNNIAKVDLILKLRVGILISDLNF